MSAASSFAEDYPESAPGPAWQLDLAFPTKVAPGHSAVDPHRLLQGRVGRKDLSGAVFSGAGFARQYVARAQALYQLLVPVWLVPAAS